MCLSSFWQNISSLTAISSTTETRGSSHICFQRPRPAPFVQWKRRKRGGMVYEQVLHCLLSRWTFSRLTRSMYWKRKGTVLTKSIPRVRATMSHVASNEASMFQSHLEGVFEEFDRSGDTERMAQRITNKHINGTCVVGFCRRREISSMRSARLMFPACSRSTRSPGLVVSLVAVSSHIYFFFTW